jgi:hypothetical protein
MDSVCAVQTAVWPEGANQMTDANGTTNGKNEKLGIVPMDKLAAVVPTKAREAHRK